jgi:signal transduction histidine kinase
MSRRAVAAGATGLVVGVIGEVAAFDGDELHLAAGDLAVGWVLIGGGIAMGRRRVGRLLAGGGFAWFAGDFVSALLYLHRGPVFHALLAYPDGRIRGRVVAVVVGAAYVDGAIAPVARSAVPTLVLCAAVGVAAVRRPGRRPAGVVGAGAVAGALAVGAIERLAGADLDDAALWVYEATLVAAVLAAVLDARLAPRAAVTGLVVDLGDEWEPVTLRDRLARALGDPSLELAYRVGDRYVDDTGRPFELPLAGSDRMLTPIDADGEEVAVLAHDRAALEDRGLLEAVAAAARVAVTNVRLEAEARERATQLEASRRRIVEAADAQRRGLRRELADGAERRLEGLSADLRELAPQVDGTPAAEALAEVSTHLAAARQELDELARGIHPAALAAGGLAEALPELARRAPVPVEVRVRGVRPPAAIEAAVYFVCAEALTNIAKHADASAASIDVACVDGSIAVTIADDGRGGAAVGTGSGLRGLADRLEAVGGSLRVESPPGGGTRVVAEVPL